MAYSKQKIRSFYNATGKLQDSQNFYEAPCLSFVLDKVANKIERNHKEISTAVEIGMGTGHFAQQLLDNYMPEEVNYYGYDISDRMIDLAEKNLSGCKQNIQLERRDICRRLPHGANSVDMIFANYLFDIMDDQETDELIGELSRILKPGGVSYISNICTGTSIFSAATMFLWRLMYQIWPKLVGFCRPVAPGTRFSQPEWNITTKYITAYGISSHVIIAQKAI